MSKKLFTKLFVFLLVVGLLFAVAPTGQAQAATKTVCTGGGCDYSTIQAAITAATAGDTITVAAGSYNENVTVNKQLTIVGAGAESVTVDALVSTSPCFHITADGVSLSGFKVTGALDGQTDAILLDDADNCTISNNIATNNYWGITLYNAANNTISENVANSNTAQGIGLVGANTTGNQIVGNTASNNASNGILLSPGVGGNNTISGNTVSANGKYGISITSSNNTVTNNIITGNSPVSTTGGGLALHTSEGYTATGNVIQFNTITGNGGYGGIGSTSTGTNDISKNWWGSATGPTNTNNPGGTGDVLWTNKAITLLTYSPWLGMAPQEAYNGTVAGVLTTSGTGAVTGTLTGAYTLYVTGQVTDTPPNRATFTGTVTGDIVGDIDAAINDMGVDTLAGIITNAGVELPIRILGIFPKTGNHGDFEGEIITEEIPPLATSMSITTPDNVSTVFSTRTLQMGVVIDPDTAEYGEWSIYDDDPATGSTIDENGLLTAGTPGTITVIAKALDGSLLDATKVITIQELPDTKLLMQTPVEGTCDSTLTQEFTVNVLVQNVTDMTGYDVEVGFDPTMVQVIEVENGTFLTGNLLYADSNGFDNATGKVNFGATLVGTGGVVTPVSGAGVLYTITFKPLKAGVSTFEINPAGSELVHYPSYLVIPFEVIGDGSLDFGGVVKNLGTGAEYCDLATAVAEASTATPETLQLLADITIPETVTVNKALTLDLNGKVASYTPPTGGGYALVVSGDGALTVNDSVTGGAIRAIGWEGRGINVKEGGDLVVNGGAIQGEYASVYVRANSSMILNGGLIGGENGAIKYSGIIVLGNGTADSAILEVKGGEIVSYDFAISGNGTLNTTTLEPLYGGTKITITAGTITSTGALGEAIYHPQAGTLAISGGTITGHQGVEMRSGTLNITGGIIHAIGNYVATADLDLKGGNSTDTGDAIFVGTSGAGYAGNVEVNISGITAVITSDEGYALREAVLEGVTFTNTKKINIIGGQLTGGVEAGEALEAVTFSQKLVDANTAGTSDLDLLPGGKYNTDPDEFVYAPYGSYFADSWWQIIDLTGTITWDPGQTGQVIGEAPLGVTVTGDDISFDGLIEWYPAVTGRPEGNRVGVQITAPAGFPTAGTTFTVFGSTYNWDAVNDGDNFVWIYPLVTTTPQSWDVVVTWKPGVVQTFTISVTSTSTLTTPPAPTITSTDVEGPYIPGVPREFSLNVSNAGGAYYALATFDYKITGVSKADITSFEYFAQDLGTWIVMGSRAQETYLECDGGTAICGQFGWAPGGFGPFPADFTGVSQFRVNFKNGKTADLPLTLTLKGKKTGAELDWTVLQTFAASIDVYENVAITGTAPDYYLVGDPDVHTITITNPAGGAPYGNHIEFNLTILGAVKADIASATCTYGSVTLDILGMLTEVGGNLTGTLFPADGAFEVGAPFGMTTSCTMVFNIAKDYTSTSEMVYVVGTDKYVVATNTATAHVYTKPVITSPELAGPFQEGLEATVTINVDNVDTMYTPNDFILHLDLPAGTDVVYGLNTIPCTATGCDIPVTLAAGANAIDLDITFNDPYNGPVTVTLVDTVPTTDRTLATFTTPTNVVVYANVAAVTGTVSMQARTTRAGVLFTLAGSFDDYPATSNDQISNNVSFTNLASGVYAITVDQARYLDITIAHGATIDLATLQTIAALQLKAGDANDNNYIDGGDASIVGTYYGTGTIADQADVNFDNKVNIQDLAIVGGNFDLQSANPAHPTLPYAYGNWMK